MASNSRKHTIPAGTDQSISRSTIFEAFGNSINDVVPVSNATERAQVVAALTDRGVGPTALSPLVVIRGDAPGLHRIEHSPDGAAWFPASGVMQFATEAAANAWAVSNSGALSTGDRCFINAREFVWQGVAPWKLARLSGTNRGSGGTMPASTMTTVATISLPANAPAGAYLIDVHTITGATTSGQHYQLVSVAGVEITNSDVDFLNAQPANVDIHRGDSLRHAHVGGAATILLRAQVNATAPYVRAARMTVAYVGG